MEKSFAKNRRFIKSLTGLILLLLCTVDVQGQKQTSSQFEVCGVFHADSIYLVRKTYTRWNWRALHWGPYHCTDYYVTTTLDKKTKRLIQRRPLDSQPSEKVMRVSPIQLSKCLTLYSEEYKQFPIIDTFLRNLLYDNLILHCGKAYRSIDIGKQMAFVSEPLEDEGNTSYHLLTHTHYFLLLKMSVAAFNEANYPLCMCGGDTTSPPYMHAQWGGRAWIECNGNLKEIAYRPKENGYTYFFPRPAKTKKKIWKALLQQIDTITNDLHAGGTFTVSFDGRSDIKKIFLIQTQDDLQIVIMPCRRFRDDEYNRNVDK